MLLKTQDTYVDFFQLDKSASPCNMRRLGAMGFFRDEFAEIPERWHLHNLVVSQHRMPTPNTSLGTWLTAILRRSTLYTSGVVLVQNFYPGGLNKRNWKRCLRR